MTMDRLDENKVAALVLAFNDAVDEGRPPAEAVALTELYEDAPPHYYSWKGYNRAIVSFDDRAKGVYVRLKDCTMQGGMAIQKATSKPSDSLTIEQMASMVRYHFDGFVTDPDDEDSERGQAWSEIFVKDPPKEGEGDQVWQSWCGNISQKNLTRLVRAIVIFRTGSGDEGNE